MYIYELSHPTTNLFYIGKSKDPTYRLNQHLKNKNKDRNYKKYLWIKELKEKDFIPEMKILLECEDKDWIEWEKAFIFAYRLKYGRNKVLNIADGGNEGPNRKGARFTDEQKQQIKDDFKSGKRQPPFGQQFSDGIIIEIFKLNGEGLSHKKIGDRLNISQQHVTDILNKNVKYMMDSKWNVYTKKVWPRPRMSEERKKEISEFFKGHKFNIGNKISQEHKDKISKACKGRKVSEETRERMSQSAKKRGLYLKE